MNSSKIKQSLDLAEQYFKKRDYRHAENIINDVLSHNPNNSKANELLAYILGNRGDPDKSLDLLLLACNQVDCSPEALYYLGSIQLKKNHFHEAVKTFNRAIQKAGLFFEALHDLGTAYANLGDYENAISCYEICIKFRPNSHELYFNIARCQDQLKRYDQALINYNQTLKLNPESDLIWVTKGLCLIELRKEQDAIYCFQKALSINNKSLEAYFHLASLFKKNGALNEAQITYDEAIKIDETNYSLWNNKANLMVQLGKLNEAKECFEQAFHLNPKFPNILGHFILSKLQICDWTDLDNLISKLEFETITGNAAGPSFVCTLTLDNPEVQKVSAKKWVSDKYQAKDDLGITLQTFNSKIKVGYFSADFRNHPVAQLIAELFELHNKNYFDVYLYSYGPLSEDAYSERIKKSTKNYFEVSNLTDLEIASLSRKHGINIAIDLGGHTNLARTGIFSYRCAPVQCQFLGYPGTMGADYIDYIIADKVLINPEESKYYSEKIIWMPESYQINDRKKPTVNLVHNKEDLGLPTQDKFIFCCFNANSKILPSQFSLWMDILSKDKNSILWLLEDNLFAKQNLITHAENYGIDSSRLVFANKISLADHLARHQFADLFLDTYPYNAHTTASDALWAGLPVLTMMGKSFASRVAASLLTAVGLEELITHSEDEYVKLALTLASDKSRINKYKIYLKENRDRLKLFNTSEFVQSLENSYQQAYTNSLNGIPNHHIYASNYSNN